MSSLSGEHHRDDINVWIPMGSLGDRVSVATPHWPRGDLELRKQFERHGVSGAVAHGVGRAGRRDSGPDIVGETVAHQKTPRSHCSRSQPVLSSDIISMHVYTKAAQ